MTVSELCLSVASVCSQWSILAKDPCLWRELSFLDNRIPLEKLCSLLRSAPLLRKLTLIGRSDCNAILREVSRSNKRLETLVMKKCTGTKTRQEIGEPVLIKILKECSKLSNLIVKDTQFRSLAFYQLLGELCNRFNHVKLLNARKEEIVCFLQACLSSPVTSTNTKGILNGQPQELDQMIDMFADDNVDLCGGLVIVDCWKVRGVLRKRERTFC
ncbi:hypothetical protein C0J52_15617 [Blattella germanica]|nr:hypothetical protein C0J52_15617 [Blattella germanica]